MAMQKTPGKPQTLENPVGNGYRAEQGDPAIENHPLAGLIGVFRDDPEYDALLEQIKKHPLADVVGSFAHDLPALDAIMAGVEDYRRRMEADENVL